MHKTFIFIALSSITLLNAASYYQEYEQSSYPNENQYFDPYHSERYYNTQTHYPNQPSQGYYRNQPSEGWYQYQQGSATTTTTPDQQRTNQKYIPDQEISKNIHDSLKSGLFSKGYENVSFDVYNGIVNLTGSVETLEDKNKVENNIKEIRGVKQVNNQLRVAGNGNDKKLNGNNDSKVKEAQKNYPQDQATTDTDRKLNAKIRDKLKRWFSDYDKEITIKTNNGNVTLTGFVRNSDDLQKINERLKTIEGIRNVNNQISIRNK